MNLKGKTIIITGAAGGIGAALARRFDREKPHSLLLLDLVPEPLGKLAAELSCANVETGICDVTDPGRTLHHVKNIEGQYGRVDLFCANAGVFLPGGAHADPDIWQRSLQINLMSHVYAAQACLPTMLARGAGYFLHTISAAGLLSQIGSAPYAVSKHGALGFAEWLAITHGEQGIGVTALCPQGVATPMLTTIDNVGSVASDGLVSAEEVADCAVLAMAKRQFLALPHPRVRDYFRRKAEDHDRWIAGMQRFQAGLQN